MKTTKLQAVNELLKVIGMDPVDTLQVGLYEVAQAESYLDTTSRQLQTGDWDFNREDDFPMSPDVNGEIVLPDNLYQIDVLDMTVVQRGSRLYDKKAHSFKFAKPVKANVVWYLPWDELPEVVRQFIYIKAAHQFQIDKLGSETTARFTKEMVAEAYMRLQRFDAETGNYNIFNDPETSYIVYGDGE